MPPHPFRPLSDLLRYGSDETLGAIDHWPDPGLVRAGLQLFRELPQSAPDEVLLATDLHAGNILRAQREPWLVIDPKPFVGDPAYDATQHLFNCTDRLQSDPETTIRRFAELLELDPERVRLWTFARAAADPRESWLDDKSIALARALRPSIRTPTSDFCSRPNRFCNPRLPSPGYHSLYHAYPKGSFVTSVSQAIMISTGEAA